jgi:hypothetical protein
MGTIDQVCASKPHLKDQPFQNPDEEWFADRSSFVREGKKLVDYIEFN